MSRPPKMRPPRRSIRFRGLHPFPGTPEQTFSILSRNS